MVGCEEDNRKRCPTARTRVWQVRRGCVVGVGFSGIEGRGTASYAVADLGQNVAHEMHHAPLVPGVRQHRVEVPRTGRRPAAPVEQGEDDAGRPAGAEVFAEVDGLLAAVSRPAATHCHHARTGVDKHGALRRRVADVFRESRGRYGYRRVKAALGTGTSPNAEPARHDAGSGPPPRCVPTSVPRSHGDRGCHYRWPGWLDRMGRYGLIRSMGAKGCSPDNAAAEGSFGRMKTRVRASPGIGRSVRARRPAASPASTSAGTTIRGSNSRWDGKAR